MMTDATTQKTARQTLGETLRFYREQRGLSPARVADMTKSSRGDVDDWEAGRAVPNSAQWELLKKMVHRGLSAMGAVRQRALSEADAERALVQRSMQRQKPEPAVASNKPLTTRPFAEALAKQPILKIVPPEPPKPEPKPEPPPPAPPPPTATPAPVTTPAGVPATLLGDDFDLTDAYTAVNTLPDGWGTAEAKEARAAFAKELLKQGLDTETIVKRTREKFTVGVSRVTLKNLRAEIEKEAAKAARAAAKAAAAAAPAPAPVPTPTPPPPAVIPLATEADRVAHARTVLQSTPGIKIEDLVKELQRKFGSSLPAQQLYTLRAQMRGPVPPAPVEPMIKEDDIKAAAQIVLGAIPNLKTFTITVDDAGVVTVNHTTREVRVVESTGSITLKK